MTNCTSCGVDVTGLNAYKVRKKWYCEGCYFKYIKKQPLKRQSDSFTPKVYKGEQTKEKCD